MSTITFDTWARRGIHTRGELMDCINALGFLPLLESGIAGYSAEAIADEECRYVVFPDGGWQWPLWEWKGPVIIEGDCVYGKFFNGKAGFVSKRWWQDFLNWRRHLYPAPEPDSVEDIILCNLREAGSMITRDLRRRCGFTGPKMRGKFDGYVTRLQRGCHIVTEDFVYPRDKHGKPYGWGWSLLTTPERLLGVEACHCPRSPQESHDILYNHLATILPAAQPEQLERLLN